jgi:hypothetical protein
VFGKIYHKRYHHHHQENSCTHFRKAFAKNAGWPHHKFLPVRPHGKREFHRKYFHEITENDQTQSMPA